MIIGGSIIPLISVQYTPQKKTNTIGVSYSWYNASARLIEQEVTSKIEGALATVDGIQDISSTSSKGSGNVQLTVKEGMKIDIVRFDIASKIRHLYPKLPDGVSYPYISLNTSGDGDRAIMTYTINSSMPSIKIDEFITKNILPRLSLIDGVSMVDLSGSTPYEYVISVDSKKMSALGISVQEVADAFNTNFRENDIGYLDDDGINILLKVTNSKQLDFGEIPIKKVDGRLIFFKDISGTSYREALPSSYYRINGLNTLNVTVYAEKNSNVLTVCSDVRQDMEQLKLNFPDNIKANLIYDSSDYVSNELHKILVRTVLTLLILLVFVLLVSRNLHYLLIISLTLSANILIAVIFYKLLNINIHIYSLAGITISLGIIIDTSIIMTDHYSTNHDRTVFPAILGALLTTIAALSVIFFMPVKKDGLGDFAAVIIINLTVSLFISLLFIPALLEKLPLKKGMTYSSLSAKRKIHRVNRIYYKFISWGRKHRWVFIVVLILGFGFPLHLLPPKLDERKYDKDGKFFKIYNTTIGGSFYQENKNIIEKTFGGAIGIFHRSKGVSGYREPERKVLRIQAGMPDGCTVQQLNEIIEYMENYLSQFDEIETYRTNVLSYNNASIEIEFKKEFENTSFPYQLQSNATRAAINYGGATWRIYGISEESFNNNIGSGYKMNRITVSGYNYDQLMVYAGQLKDSLSVNQRVKDPVINTDGWSMPKNEFLVEIDNERAVMENINIYSYFNSLRQILFNQRLSSIFVGGKEERVSLVSSMKDEFDLWNVKNVAVAVDSAQVKFNDFATIEKYPIGLDIKKYNQTYEVLVAYDFVGSWELSGKLQKRLIDAFNGDILPIGYKAKQSSYSGWGYDSKKNYALIFLISLIIFFICSIIFESLRQPFAIILLIPISFIGIFLFIGLFDFDFDQGGFASMIMLCGIVVNAGIYLINDYQVLSNKYYSHKRIGNNNVQQRNVKLYIKSFNRKIVPIMLTILSTFLGLIPFLYDGKNDVFWYSFAVGTMSGLFFSIFVLIFIMPVFLPFKKKPNRIH